MSARCKMKVQVTTVRLYTANWQWLREQAFKRALADGGRPDASAIVNELIEQAMRRTK